MATAGPSLEQFRAVLNKFYRMAASLGDDDKAALLAMFDDAYQRTVDQFFDGVEPVFESKQAPAPVEEDDDDQEDDEDAPLLVTQELLESFKVVERYIGEKLYQQGKAAHDLFACYDRMHSGTLAPAAFAAALGSIGVALTPTELRLLAYKFPAPEDEDTGAGAGAGAGEVDYETFLQYCEALRAKPRSSANASADAAVLSARATSMSALLKNVKVPFAAQLAAALKAMRGHMYARSVAVPAVFKCIKSQETGLVPCAALIAELPKLGFPATLVTAPELAAYVASKVTTPGAAGLSYNEFAAFFRGDDDVAELGAGAGAGAKSVLFNPSLTQALVKLNSMPLRAHFKQVDFDGDALLSVPEVVADLVALGMSPELAKSEELAAFILSFAGGGKQTLNGRGGLPEAALQYSDFVRFANHRVGGSLTQPAVGRSLALDITGAPSVSEAVWAVHNAAKTGAVSMESVFARYCAHGSQRLSAAGLWHAWGDMGVTIDPETSAGIFALCDPVVAEEDAATGEPSVDYKEVALMLLFPARHPRIAPPAKGRRAPGGESTVPLGSSVQRLASEFRDPGVAVSGKQAATAAVKFSHAHRWEGQPATDAETDAAAAKAARPPRQVNVSTLALADPQPGDVIPPLSFGATRKLGGKGAAHVKGKVDFGGDHGGATPVTARASARFAPASTFVLSGEYPVDEDAVPASTSASTSKTASDIFCARPESSPKAVRRAMKAPPTPGVAHKSSVSFDQTDSEPYQPMKTRMAPPGGRTSVMLAHDDNNPCPPEMSVTGFNRRRASNVGAAKASLSLADDAGAGAGAAPLAKASRRHFDATTARGSVDHLGMGAQPADTPYIMRRQTRGAGTAAPAAGGSFVVGDGQAEQGADLVRRIDALVLSPRGAAAAAASTNAEPIPLSFDEDDEAGAGAGAGAGAAAPKVDLALLSRRVYEQGKAKKVFSDWTLGAALLTKGGLVAGAASAGVPLTDAQAAGVLAQFDKDGKGALSFSEFIRLLAAKDA